MGQGALGLGVVRIGFGVVAPGLEWSGLERLIGLASGQSGSE